MDILSKIVDSDSKAKLLVKLLERPTSSFSVSECGRLASLPKATVSNIIAQWQETGLVHSRQQGRNKLVLLNSKFYLLPELKKIFEKTKDFQKPLLRELESMATLKSQKIKAAVVFGSRTRKDYVYSSDFDVLIVVEDKNGKISERIVQEFVEATKKTGIRFSPLILGKKGFKNRWKEKDKLVMNILSDGKVLKGGKWLEHIQAAR
ncbi:MAG: nucleotidyltransferase domain-containing protein [Candidatus Diapherotrites archaeon]|nr:nucleotidyltransferase domain-containing protein [Candidatus Diapherotrites archaeon]